MFIFTVSRQIFTACWYTTALCAAVRQQATLHPLNYTQGFSPPPLPSITALKRDTVQRLWHSITANVNVRYNPRQTPNCASSNVAKEKRLPRLWQVAGHKLEHGFRRTRETAHRSRPCHAGASAARVTRLLAPAVSAAPGTPPQSRGSGPRAAATPLRLQPRHQPRGRGGRRRRRRARQAPLASAARQPPAPRGPR